MIWIFWAKKEPKFTSTVVESFALLAAAMRHALMLHQIIIEAESGARVDDLITRYAGRTVFGPRKEALVNKSSNGA